MSGSDSAIWPAGASVFSKRAFFPGSSDRADAFGDSRNPSALRSVHCFRRFARQRNRSQSAGDRWWGTTCQPASRQRRDQIPLTLVVSAFGKQSRTPGGSLFFRLERQPPFGRRDLARVVPRNRPTQTYRLSDAPERAREGHRRVADEAALAKIARRQFFLSTRSARLLS